MANVTGAAQIVTGCSMPEIQIDPAALSDAELLAAWRKICTHPDLTATWPPEQRGGGGAVAQADEAEGG